MPYQQKAGLHHVGSYQVSGYPFVTGSTVTAGGPSNGEVRVEFPTVANNLTVINTSTPGLRVYFNALTASNGANGAGAYPDGAPIDGLHFITLEDKKDSVTFGVKCKEVFIAFKGRSTKPVGQDRFQAKQATQGNPNLDQLRNAG